jgi:hypothetical protein
MLLDRGPRKQPRHSMAGQQLRPSSSYFGVAVYITFQRMLKELHTPRAPLQSPAHAASWSGCVLLLCVFQATTPA